MVDTEHAKKKDRHDPMLKTTRAKLGLVLACRSVHTLLVKAHARLGDYNGVTRGPPTNNKSANGSHAAQNKWQRQCDELVVLVSGLRLHAETVRCARSRAEAVLVGDDDRDLG